MRTRRGAVDPAGGGEALLLEIELRDRWDLARRVQVRILQGPAGCCLDYARPRATPNVTIREGIGAQLIEAIGPELGGPIVWWVENGAYVALASPTVSTSELLRIARSMTPLR